MDNETIMKNFVCGRNANKKFSWLIHRCINQIKNIINLSVEEATAIRENARSRSIHSAYSYEDRTKQALNYISSLIDQNNHPL